MIEYKGLKLYPVLERGCDKPPQCNPDELELFLKEEQLQLDQSYKKFLIDINGGRIWYKQEPCFYLDSKKKKKRAVTVLYPFYLKDKWESVNGIWQRGLDFYPRILFPMGYDDQDGVISIGAGGRILGNIFVLYSQKTRLTPKSTDEDILKDPGVYLVAESFNEFIDNIEIVEEKKLRHE